MTNIPPPPVPKGLGPEEFPPLGQEKVPKLEGESTVPPSSVSRSAPGVDLMVPAAFVRK